MVLGRRFVTLGTDDPPGPGNTRGFDLVLDVDDVFFYDPALGNLLLDIRNFTPDPAEELPVLDAAGVVGGAVSRVLAHDVLAADGTVATPGLVTAFDLPEPGRFRSEIAAATLFGLAGLAARRASRGVEGESPAPPGRA